ncbi:restriction endonuclease subunit S [Acinetobacter sp. YH12208]|uniref:restriction endonuclease subunit S n=1 Tax=Acinetobacter sp. YH12208 TaxID=2601144 RepID=UPI0015D2A85A|nr:restriction endonuclease subunit S [Acinetobacter sp. YH12208]
MAKYEIYQTQVETHNSWIKLIPKEWQVVPLKYMCNGFVKDGPHETPKFIDEGIPFLSVDGIQNNKLVFEGCRYISIEDDARFSLKCKPQKGNILLGKAASVGKVAFVENDYDFNVWSPLAVISPKDIRLGKFIFYCLQSYELQLQCDVFSNSNTQKNLGMTTIDNLTFPYPSISEAQNIANFLDHETAKIDSLIAKQEKLIELLKEKRQAVISHAVTKGLNPDVNMKDSGVEWLGQVPEHWRVSRFKFVCSSIIAGPFGSSITKDMYVPKGYKVYGQEQVIPNDFEIGDYYISEKNYIELSRYAVYPKDILISCVGTFGKIAVFTENAEKGIINPRLIKATVSNKFNPYFIREYLKSDAVFKQFEQLSRGGTMGVINIGILNEIIAVIPPIKEQDDIYNFIQQQKYKFNNLIKKAQSAIQLMQERRTALISSAVTGKIDVRNWQNPNEAKMEFSA